MTEQDLEYYIQKLKLLKELEGNELLHSEVVIKYQDRIVSQMLDIATIDDFHEKDEQLRIPLQIKEKTLSAKQVVSSNRKCIFISYCHKDKKWLEKLCTILAPLVHQKILHIWTDRQIEPGANWQEAVRHALASTRVAILLVTPNFLASDFIAKHELSPLLETAKQEGLIILWVAVSASLYKETEIAVYQPINDPARPLDSLSPANLNKELVYLCEQIKKIAHQEPPALYHEKSYP